MPRRSFASLTTLPVNGERRRRLAPPSTLNDAERALFQEIVGSCSPKHFVLSDRSLLVTFVKATLLAEQASRDAATDDGELARWEKACRVQATLATRLRLSPQARADPKSILRQQPNAGPHPWENWGKRR